MRADPAIGALTRIMGLIGRDISHTLSPILHNAAMLELGIDGAYLAFDCQQSFPAGSFFDVMWDVGAFGFNVTVPYKELAARTFPNSGLTSINTIYRSGSGWATASTDGPGFLLGLNQLNLSLSDFDTVIYLGNGGAALALSETFVRQAPLLRHRVLRRNPLRDSIWRELCKGSDLELHDFSPLVLADLLARYPRSLLIQTTSAPLSGNDLRPMAQEIRSFRGAFVDLVYGKPSALLTRCRDLGVPSQDGIPMLVGQALIAEKLWWGKGVAFEFLEKIARKQKERRGS